MVVSDLTLFSSFLFMFKKGQATNTKIAKQRPIRIVKEYGGLINNCIVSLAAAALVIKLKRPGSV